jgi:hypothetical protein
VGGGSTRKKVGETNNWKSAKKKVRGKKYGKKNNSKKYGKKIM